MALVVSAHRGSCIHFRTYVPLLVQTGLVLGRVSSTNQHHIPYCRGRLVATRLRLPSRIIQAGAICHASR
jgi:hypothetical protein